MKLLKKAFLTILIAAAGMTAFAGTNSFIKITSGYNHNEVNVYYDKINDSKGQLSGEVSSDCISIRVLWSPKSLKVLEEYLVRGKRNPGEDSLIDDYVLKQYKKGSETFVYNISGSYDNLAYGSNFYKFVATFSDQSIKICDYELYVHTGGVAERGKPVIYLYPEQTQEISVKVLPEGGVTQSIPDYKDGWTVTATPEGKITNKEDGQEYPYLFWESDDSSTDINLEEGFVVQTKKLEAFFEEKLALLGLNEKEIADFNEFWVPELQGKKYVFITFHSQQRIDEESPLVIEPAPDTVIRVFFDHKKLDKKIKVKPQELTAPERKGFTVTEWGGKRYK